MAQLGPPAAEIEKLSNVLSLINTFRAFDSDNDGFITLAELGGILSSLGYKITEQDVRVMMQEADKNKDGLLSLEEFIEMNTKDTELGGLGNFLQTALECLNVDGDEIFTGEMLHETVNKLGFEYPLEECEGLIATMDGEGVTLEDLQLIFHSIS